MTSGESDDADMDQSALFKVQTELSLDLLKFWDSYSIWVIVLGWDSITVCFGQPPREREKDKNKKKSK